MDNFEKMTTVAKQESVTWKEYEAKWIRENYGQLMAEAQSRDEVIRKETIRSVLGMRELANSLGYALEVWSENGAKSITINGQLYRCPSAILRAPGNQRLKISDEITTDSCEYRLIDSEARLLGGVLRRELLQCLNLEDEEPTVQRLIWLIDNSRRFRRVLESSWGKMLRFAVDVEAAGGKATMNECGYEYSFTAPGLALPATFAISELKKAQQWMAIYLPASRRKGFTPYRTRDERRELKRQLRTVQKQNANEMAMAQ